AFSSHYGNALSGVFDLKWRRGNTDTREYLAQIGFNGFELGAEGPIGSKQQASYMVFYRYSTLGVFKALNIPFGTGSAVPEYQDYNMRIDWSTKRYGHFMLWSMGGVSTIALLYKDKLRAGANSLYGYANRNAYFNSKIGVLGMSHHYPINSKSYVSTYFGFSGSQNNIASDYIDSAFSTPDFTIPEYRQDFSVLKTGLHSVYHYKLNSKHFFESGIYIERIHLHLFDSSAIFFKPLLYSRLRHYTGAYFSNRWYAQWQIKMNARLRIQGGIYAQYLSLNSHAVIEPRFSIKYTHINHHLGFACGLHSQTQPYYMYFSTTNFGALTNTSLDFTKALHVVLSHDFNLKSIWHFKSEAYYQYLYKVPVTYSASSFSALNLGADFLSPNITGLTNSGSGLNYGIEFTIERYFNAKYYILTTGSFFNSRYCGSDAIWRNTAFNGNYVINGLGGKEFQLTPAVSVIVDFKSTWAGGKRFTPIDLEKSRAQKKEIRFTDKAFSEQYPNYFRLDIRPGIRINKKHVTHELQIDFQNITQHDNVFQQTYNPKTQQLEYDYQLKLFIVPQYRILF
ncbi:MAG: TonB-dependent receptor, partial [Bacteroidia bacterium]